MIFSNDSELIDLGTELFYQLYPDWVFKHDARTSDWGKAHVVRAQYRVIIKRLEYAEGIKEEDIPDVEQ